MLRIIYTLLILGISGSCLYWLLHNFKNKRSTYLNTFLIVAYSIVLFTGTLIFHQSTTAINLKPSYDFQNSLNQFIGTILAIFFTLAVVPIQNLVHNTSHTIVNRILKDSVFMQSFMLLVSVFLLILAQYLVGTNNTINKYHFVLLCIVLIDFMIIIYRSIRFLDVKKIISDYEADAINFLNLKWSSVASKNTDLKKQTEQMMLIKEGLINDTKIMIEPIFVTTKKYIVLDQYDIVTKGLNSIVNIAYRYIDIFKFSVEDNDRLLLYIIERFKDLRDAVSSSAHYSIVPNLVFATKLLALKSLEIKTPLSSSFGSYLQLGLINFLEEFVVSKEILKDTSSASMDGVSALEEIGIMACQQKNFHIAKAVLDILSNISVSCTKLNFLYANAVSKESNRAIMVLNFHMLSAFEKNRILPDILAESISKPIEAFIEVGQDNPRKDNLSPFIGTGIDTSHLFDPYQMRQFLTIPSLVFYSQHNKSFPPEVLIEYLEEVFSSLNQLIMKANKKNMPFTVSEIIDVVYSVSFVLFQLQYEGKFDRLTTQEFKKLMDSRILYMFSNSVYPDYDLGQVELHKNVQSWVSVIGFYLIAFETWDGFPSESLKTMIEFSDKLETKAAFEYKGEIRFDRGILNDLEVFYRAQGLCLYWQFTLILDKHLEKMLIISTFRYKDHFEYSSKRSSDYLPESHISYLESWSIEQPYCPYYTGPRHDFAVLLSVTEPSKSKFIYEYMKRNERIAELIQLFKNQIKQHE